MSDVIVTVQVVDNQLTPAPLDDVLVKVYSGSDVFLTEGMTGTLVPGSGEVEFLLNGEVAGEPYILRLKKNGVSFPPAPTFDILVLDPPDLTNNTFEYEGVVGDPEILVTLTVKDGEGSPLEETRIRVYDAADAFLTASLTNVVGKLILSLEGYPDPGKTYIVRLAKPDWIIEGGATQQIRVFNPLVPPETNIFDFTAAKLKVPVSTDDNMCLVSGYFVDAANRPLNRTRVRCIPLYQDPSPRTSGFPGAGTPSIIGRNQIIREAIFETEEDGYVGILLPRGSIHEVHIHGYEIPGLPTVASVYIPDAPSAKLEDIFFPFALSVDFDNNDLDLIIGETQELEVVLTNSDTRDVSEDLTIVEFQSSDEEVAVVGLNDSGGLTVTAIGVGTATIGATRTAGTWVTRVPDIPDLVVAAVSIEVTA